MQLRGTKKYPVPKKGIFESTIFSRTSPDGICWFPGWYVLEFEEVLAFWTKNSWICSGRWLWFVNNNYILAIHFPHFLIPTNLCCKWKRHPDPAIIMFEYCLCQLCKISYINIGWWFQICFMFTPTWGDDPFCLIFFKWVETNTWNSIFHKIPNKNRMVETAIEW